MNLTGQLKSFAFVTCLLLILGPVSPAGAFEINDDFTDGDFAGWTVDNSGTWSVADAIALVLHIKNGTCTDV